MGRAFGPGRERWPVAEHLTLKESKRNRRREREREHTPHPPDFSQISGPGALALPRLPSCGDWQPALQRTTRTGNAAGPQLGAGKLAHRRLRTGLLAGADLEAAVLERAKFILCNKGKSNQ